MACANNSPITRRFDLNMGKRCNARCLFCYYLEEIESGDTGDLTTQRVKDILLMARGRGKTRVDLTGGEPTLRKDLPEVIAYAREIGYETVCIITNCLITRKPGRLEEYKTAGLNDILVSLHSHDSGLHDRLVRVPGAYEGVIETIRRAKELGINTRINHVVSNLNFRDVSRMAALADSFSPDAMNFIMFNPTRDAIHADEEVPLTYREISSHLQEMAAGFSPRFRSLNFRHIPFCFLKGFEKHVKTMWQLQYEKVEWDYIIDVTYKRGRWYMYAASLLGAALLLGNTRFLKAPLAIKHSDSLQRARIFNDRRQPAKCRSCALRRICDGLPKEYLRKRGGEEVSPYLDHPTVLDPAHFIPEAERESP